MKLLNKKGFTLIELLAVIVILGLVMIITMPSIIDATNNAKYKQLQNAANKVADWFLEQYSVYQIDPSGVDSSYKSNYETSKYNWNVSTYTKKSCTDCTNGFASIEVRSVFHSVMNKAGLSSAEDNFNAYVNSGDVSIPLSTVFFNESKGKFCVKLQAKSGGQFYNNSDVNKNVAFSSGCPIKEPFSDYKWSCYTDPNNKTCVWS